jgi:hypothetical protein
VTVFAVVFVVVAAAVYAVLIGLCVKEVVRGRRLDREDRAYWAHVRSVLAEARAEAAGDPEALADVARIQRLVPPECR